jgi:CheY-like chemotaxis protein
MTDIHTPSPSPILVVDDNVDAAESLAIMLELEGYTVSTAFRGQQALERAEASPPRVVLLDLTLPDLDGYEVARRLRAREAAGSERVLLVAISGRGSAEDLKAAEEAGFDKHFLKPVTPEAILQWLADQLADPSTNSGAPGI